MSNAEKIVSFIVHVTLTLFFLYELTNAILKLQRHDIGATISFESISDLRHPSLTFIKMSERNVTTFNQVHEEQKRRDFVVKASYTQKLDNGSRSNINLLDADEAKRHGWDFEGMWQDGMRSWFEMYSPIYVTFNAPFPVVPGITNRVSFSVNVSDPILKMVFVVLHNRDQLLPTTAPFSGSHTILYLPDKGSTHSSFRLYRFSTKHIKRQRVNSRACHKSDSVDFVSCFDNYVQNKIGCSYPWKALETSGLPVCAGYEELQRFSTLSEKLYTLPHVNLTKTTGCKVPCDYFQLTANLMYGTNTNPGSKGLFNLVFYTVDTELAVEEQGPVYVFSNLVADVGGYLGLLLGVSFLSSYKMLLRNFRNWRKHREVNKQSVKIIVT